MVALADTLGDQFDVRDLLTRVVSECVDLLAVEAAAVIVRGPERNHQVVASSDEATRAMATLQLHRQAGPCVDAFLTGEPIAIDDLAELDGAVPALRSALEAAGYSRMYAVPLRLRDDTIGALNLFKAGPALSDSDRRLARAVADVTTIAILQARRLSRASILAEQLQTALNTRVVVERAIGVLAEHGGIEMGAAFDALRSYARSHRVNLTQVAHLIVTRELDASRVVEPPRS
jgi:GAF domain-containing protein